MSGPLILIICMLFDYFSLTSTFEISQVQLRTVLCFDVVDFDIMGRYVLYSYFLSVSPYRVVITIAS